MTDLVKVNPNSPLPYAHEFVEVDFTQPILVVPESHSDMIIPDSWEDVSTYEGVLPEEHNDDWKPIVSRWEIDAWDNGIDGDDMQKGPDPYGDDDYTSVFTEALKVHDKLYAI